MVFTYYILHIQMIALNVETISFFCLPCVVKMSVFANFSKEIKRQLKKFFSLNRLFTHFSFFQALIQSQVFASVFTC